MLFRRIIKPNKSNNNCKTYNFLHSTFTTTTWVSVYLIRAEALKLYLFVYMWVCRRVFSHSTCDRRYEYVGNNQAECAQRHFTFEIPFVILFIRHFVVFHSDPLDSRHLNVTCTVLWRSRHYHNSSEVRKCVPTQQTCTAAVPSNINVQMVPAFVLLSLRSAQAHTIVSQSNSIMTFFLFFRKSCANNNETTNERKFSFKNFSGR